MLSFRISLLVTEHSNGSFTVKPLGFSDLETWGLEVEDVQEDLELALIDRLERSHPRLLPRMVAPRLRTLETLPIKELVEVLGREERLLETPVDVVLEPDSTSIRVWIPRLNARLWVPEGEAVPTAVAGHLERSLRKATHAQRLALKAEKGMTLVALELEVEPASLEAFTGEHFDKALLAAPSPKEEEEEEKRKKGVVPTPTLERLAFELSGPRAHGRDEEVEALLRMLEKPGAVVVVGPPGCGKTAVIQEVANRLKERKGWFCDASRLVTIGFGGWRSQTLDVVQELAASKALWFCGDPVQLLDAGKHVGSEMNVSQLLKPWLSARHLHVLGECTEAGWARLEARDAGFARLFTPYRLKEPAVERIRAVLAAIAKDLPVAVLPEGVEATAELGRRYGPPDALLGTSARFLRRLAAEAKARDEAGPLGRVAVISRFCAESGMPPILVRDELPLDPEAVRASFRDRVIGQDAAVDRLVELIAVIKGGMSDLGRPLGSFLFVGPTGVGKTESAKALAAWMFGASDRVLRFDMSEYSGPDCLQKLLDPHAGLVAKVRAQPFCVVLLDEIEKAHDAIFDLLLQVLGEARLSDAQGRAADFRNAVILLTSNLGVGTFRRPTGFGKDLGTELQSHVLAEVEKFFRPELFNRIDRVVPFASLQPEHIEAIAVREVQAVCQRSGLKGRGVTLDAGPEVVAWLAKRGCDPQFGARPLKRAVNEQLVSPLARHLSAAVPPSIVVKPSKARLKFVNQEGSSKTASDASLRELLVRASELRFLARCWGDCADVRKARREVQLADRMMQTKRFWKDRKAAEARSGAVEPLRELLLELDAAHSEVLALEELAHEHWRQRDGSALGALEEQAGEIARKLEASALQVAGLRLGAANIARLRFWAGEDHEPFCRQLLVAYCQLGIDLGWELEINGREWPGNHASESAFLHKLKKLPGPPWTLRLKGPGAGALLCNEAGSQVLRTDSEPQRCRVGFATARTPEEPSLATLRQWDPRKHQLKDVRVKTTTTLHARHGSALLQMLRLDLCVRVLGPERGQRVWKGMAWS